MDKADDLLPFLKKSRKKGKNSSRKKHRQEGTTQIDSNEAPLTIGDFKDTSGKLLTEDQQPPRPCILEALGSAASGAFIGALYGFGTKVVFFKGKGRFAAARGEAISTGKAFGSFGGLYALTSCIAKRLRNKDDIIATASAGAATGFLMGIQGGLQSGLSCAAFTCAISVFIDKMQPEAATASEGRRSRQGLCSQPHDASDYSEPSDAALSRRSLVSCLLCPALPLQASQACKRLTSNHVKALEAPLD